MPCNTVHLFTAGRVLARWGEDPGASPLPLSQPGAAEAFLHGAVAPDMGFVPGVDRWVSELAHWVRPADLARALVDAARTPVETAFAWGWVAHLLTDVALHPLVGRASGERLYGDPSIRLNASDDEATHVGIEVGLDILLLRGGERIPPPPTRPLLDTDRATHLRSALESTYGVPWDGEALARAHRRAVRLSRVWPWALGIVAAGSEAQRDEADVAGSPWEWVARTTTSVGRRLARTRGAAFGFFTPLAPPTWLVDEVYAEAARFPDRFQEVVEGGLGDVENRNLESGALPGSDDRHPASEEAARKLKRMVEVARSAPR
jgi:hypothetical protein